MKTVRLKTHIKENLNMEHSVFFQTMVTVDQIVVHAIGLGLLGTRWHVILSLQAADVCPHQK